MATRLGEGAHEALTLGASLWGVGWQDGILLQCLGSTHVEPPAGRQDTQVQERWCVVRVGNSKQKTLSTNECDCW